MEVFPLLLVPRSRIFVLRTESCRFGGWETLGCLDWLIAVNSFLEQHRHYSPRLGGSVLI